jgi:NAD(P)-dependent dehydrogenase (short-subunit alcohol dehydrogenase family)
MNELRFDGRTAVVTGAGGNPSLGRAHALLLAERGANVIVNDIGRLPAALGYPGEASAEAVAAEIRSLGGNAIADTNSVETEAGAAAIVSTALDAFGSVDILINNAGICRVVSFEDMTPADFRQTIEVNFMGTVWTCRAAWKHMKAKRYGRIVNISSGSMAGFAWQTAYAASKAAVFSFTRSLAAEGAEHGIKARLRAWCWRRRRKRLRGSATPASICRRRLYRPRSRSLRTRRVRSLGSALSRWAGMSVACILRAHRGSALRE